MILLLPIGLLALGFTAVMFTLYAWLKALVCVCEARFMASGAWLCVGIFMVDVLAVVFADETWADFTAIYIFVLICSVAGTITKHVLRIRRQLHEPQTHDLAITVKIDSV